MIWLSTAVNFVMNNKIAQAIGGIALLLLGAKVWKAKLKREGAAEQKAKQHQAQTKADAETRKRIDETPSNNGDRDVALNRLRSRVDRNKPKGGV